MNEELLKSRMLQYSAENGYPATHFAISLCAVCRCKTFTMLVNTDDGVAVRTCISCDDEIGMGDSDEYFDDVEELFPVRGRHRVPRI